MTAAERFVLETQVKAWLAAMRRAWVKRYGTERGECSVPAYEAMTPADRMILLVAQDAANRAGKPANIARLTEAQSG